MHYNMNMNTSQHRLYLKFLQRFLKVFFSLFLRTALSYFKKIFPLDSSANLKNIGKLGISIPLCYSEIAKEIKEVG